MKEELYRYYMMSIIIVGYIFAVIIGTILCIAVPVVDLTAEREK